LNPKFAGRIISTADALWASARGGFSLGSGRGAEWAIALN
jgi:hypothetical protein